MRKAKCLPSWKRSGGKIYRGGLFERWLREQEQLKEDEIQDILSLAENGKLELQTSAMLFMKKHDEQNKKERNVAYLGGYFDECGGTSFKLIEELVEEAISNK